MEKTKKGCLVVHGLTGTPANLQPIMDALSMNEYVVRAPLLAGHGVSLDLLAQSTRQQWYENLRDEFESLSKEAEEIYFVGLSMGGILGLKLAQNFGNRIKALALLAPPIQLTPLFRFLIVPGLRYTPLRWIVHNTNKDYEKSVRDPAAREYYRQHSLHKMPSHAVIEMLDLTKEVCKHLKKISQPMILLQGRRDHLVDPHGLLKIKKGVRSNRIELVMLPHSGHVLSLDYDCTEAARRIVNFFATAANAG